MTPAQRIAALEEALHAAENTQGRYAYAIPVQAVLASLRADVEVAPPAPRKFTPAVYDAEIVAALANPDDDDVGEAAPPAPPNDARD